MQRFRIGSGAGVFGKRAGGSQSWTFIGAPATVIDGFVNGGYGPDLSPLVKDVLIKAFPDLAALVGLGVPFPEVLAGGLINQQRVETEEFIFGTCPLCLKFDLPVQITLPGTIPTLQGLVGTLLDIGGSSASAAAPEMETMSINNVDTSNEKKLVTLDVVPDLGGTSGAVKQLTERVLPKVPGSAQKNIENVIGKLSTGGGPIGGPRLNVEKVNPLDRSNAKDEKDAVGTDTDVKPSNSHKPGKDKVSVSDLTEKVKGGLGIGREKNKDDGGDSEE